MTRKLLKLAALVVMRANEWDGQPRNNRVAGLGDSLTQAGFLIADIHSFLNYNASLSSGAYLPYALMLPKTGDSISEGRFLPSDCAALTGQSIDSIYTTYLPRILAMNPRPGFCAVLAGTNDLADWVSVPAHMATALAKVEAMYKQLISARIVPIACGLPTVGVAGSLATRRAVIPTFNAAVEALADTCAIPYVDFFTLTDNGTDGWKENYCGNPGAGDNHPSALGAAAMGQALRDLLDPYAVNFAAPNLVTETTDATADLLWGNGAFLDDADADGIPDGYGTAEGWDIPTGAADLQLSLAPEEGVVSGNWWRINKVANTANSWLRSLDITITEGQKFEFGFMAKALNPHADAVINIQVLKKNTATNYVDVFLRKLTGNVAPFKTLFTAAGLAGTTTLKIYIILSGNVVDFYIGQLTLRKVG